VMIVAEILLGPAQAAQGERLTAPLRSALRERTYRR
jgi:hypothetical protein